MCWVQLAASDEAVTHRVAVTPTHYPLSHSAVSSSYSSHRPALASDEAVTHSVALLPRSFPSVPVEAVSHHEAEKRNFEAE